jgi:hypothetical protein
MPLLVSLPLTRSLSKRLQNGKKATTAVENRDGTVRRDVGESFYELVLYSFISRQTNACFFCGEECGINTF